MGNKRPGLGKVERAVHAANATQPMRGFISPDAQICRDEGKLAVMREILVGLCVNDSDAETLLRRVEGAVIQFHWAREVKPGDQKKKLDQLVKAMDAAAKAWADLGPDLQQSVRAFGRTGRTSPFDASELTARAAALRVQLDANSAHFPADYQFVILLCLAWRDYGLSPTLTRHVNEHRGERDNTPFERFLSAAIAPATIGERVIRDALAAFGDK